jgi:hypothetical protein
MNQEIINSKLNLRHDHSIIGKLKRFLGISKITYQDINYMRFVLKSEFKRYYIENAGQDMLYFDEKIDRLPKDMIIDIYEQYELAKQALKDLNSSLYDSRIKKLVSDVSNVP